MKKLRIIALIICLSVIMATPATAQMRMRDDYGHGQHTIVDITKLPDLDLTHEQTVRLRTSREKNLREVKPYRHKIESLQHEILKLRAEIMEINAAYRQGSLNLLTEKQRAILEDCEEKRGYGFGGGTRGRGGMERLE